MNYVITKQWKEMISKRNDSELNNFIDSYEALIDALKIKIRYVEDELIRRQNMSKEQDETPRTDNNTSNGSL